MLRDAPLREKSKFALPAEMDSRWAVVERVCNSAPLQRSAKLRDLLIYLCHRCWVDGVGEIRDHDIGVDVFQRTADYDSAQDTLVRVQASQLRKRLERYFSDEGRDEPMVLEIAKGTYEPVLRERAAAVPPAAEALPQMEAAGPRWTVRLLSIACLLLGCLSIWLAVRHTEPAIEGAVLRRFWTAFAPPGQETTVVIADAAFSAVQDILHRPILLSEYVSRGYRTELDRPDYSAEKKDVLRYLMERRYTSLADIMLMKRLWAARVLDPARTSVLYSRDLNLRNFQKGNHILVGSRRAVPWVDLFDESLDFHFVYDEKTRSVSVENRRPVAGEPASFSLPEAGKGIGERFSVVAFLPNPGKTGNILILSGQEMSGTEAAADLVTTDRLFQEVLAKLPQKGSEVPYFEALLRVKHVEYTMQSYEILAVHSH
ncbi:hypothetical protein [uncultured Paludibaculum sp.]|uniref:hypothetical protein n=1 Tax=uncultured Paludibaculum sp. TaxID=1765020 RepID=UPI002AAAA452|nr:hypothetical protein [uncultured Paludibaculum sp.]